MDEPAYSNREIREMFMDTTKTLARIEEQTTMHNGRMTKLEQWRYYISGGMSVIVIIVLPILVWALWVLVNIQGQVHTAVDDALSAYDFIKE